MLTDELNVSIRQRTGITVIDLSGDLTTFAEDKITSAYDQVTNQGAGDILLNFQQNDYINSAGMAILIGIVTQAQRNNQRMAICGLSLHFQRIFRMVGLAQYIEIYQDENEAIAGLAALPERKVLSSRPSPAP
jgi:anti-anti-sigma factor